MFIKNIKRVAVAGIVIFIFLIVLNIIGADKNFKARADIGSRAKKTNAGGILLHSEAKPYGNITGGHAPVSAAVSACPHPAMSSHSGAHYLKDIFYFPSKTGEKYNRPFEPAVSGADKGKGEFKGQGGYAAASNGPGGLPYLIKNMDFKGFPAAAAPSAPVSLPPRVFLIFTSGKTALIKIGGGSYYVNVGEKIKGIFILRVGLSGISYSEKGKIKHLYF